MLDFAQFQRADRSQLLAQFSERRELPGRGPDAPVQNGHPRMDLQNPVSLPVVSSGTFNLASVRSCSGIWPPLERRESPVIVNHYNVQPVFDVLANVQGRDLGGVADEVAKVVDEFQVETAARHVSQLTRAS